MPPQTRICLVDPTRTRYRVQTVFQAVQTEVVTEVDQVGPSIVTNVVPTRVCSPRPWSGNDCRWTTVALRTPLPGSTATRTRTIRESGRTVVSSPITTLFSTSCFTDTTWLSPGSHSTLNRSSTFSSIGGLKTLIPNNDGNNREAPNKLNIGAVVGGLLGGFLTPILLVILIRYLLRRRRMYSPSSGPDMRSRFSGGSPPPISPRATSPNHTLYQSPTSSEAGHHVAALNAAMDPPSLDRRISKTSRMSRTSFDRRGGPSPIGSSHGHESIYTAGSVVRRPSMVYYGPQSHPPVAYGPRAASPVHPIIHLPPSPVQTFRGGTYAATNDYRRGTSPVGSITRDRGGAVSPKFAPQQDGGPGPYTEGPGYVAGAPLTTLNEHNPQVVVAKPISEGGTSTSRTSSRHRHAGASVQSHNEIHACNERTEDNDIAHQTTP